MKVSVTIHRGSQLTFSGQNYYDDAGLYRIDRTIYTIEADGPNGRRALLAAAVQIINDASDEELREFNMLRQTWPSKRKRSPWPFGRNEA